MSGRKPIPDHERKKERRLYVTDAVWTKLCDFLDTIIDVSTVAEKPRHNETGKSDWGKSEKLAPRK